MLELIALGFDSIPMYEGKLFGVFIEQPPAVRLTLDDAAPVAFLTGEVHQVFWTFFSTSSNFTDENGSAIATIQAASTSARS